MHVILLLFEERNVKQFVWGCSPETLGIDSQCTQFSFKSKNKDDWLSRISGWLQGLINPSHICGGRELFQSTQIQAIDKCISHEGVAMWTFVLLITPTSSHLLSLLALFGSWWKMHFFSSFPAFLRHTFLVFPPFFLGGGGGGLLLSYWLHLLLSCQIIGLFHFFPLPSILLLSKG